MSRYPVVIGVLAATWGASYVFIKVGVEGGFSPTAFIASRTLIATLILGVYLVATTGARASVREIAQSWRPVLVLGVLNAALVHRQSLVAYLIPAFALLYGAVGLNESVRPAALVGLALILLGVTLGSGFLQSDRFHPRREATP